MNQQNPAADCREYPSFLHKPDCDLCPLHLSANHPFIKTRPLYPDRPPTSYPSDLLVVGESPGNQEDAQQICWIGSSGQLLAKFLEATGITSLANIYLSNACRCRPPQHSSGISHSCISKCRQHLLADIKILQQFSGRPLTILCCGQAAADSITSIRSLTQCFSLQGSVHQETSARVFFTYHPAILLPGRRPAYVHAVQSHLLLLRSYLSEGTLPFSKHDDAFIQNTPLPEPDSINPFRPVSVDLETYGILEGRSQTVFRPVKSRLIDGVPFKEQVITVCFAYYRSEGFGGGISSCLYRFKDPKTTDCLIWWFNFIRSRKMTLIGQNIPFDLSYLYFANHVLPVYIEPYSFQIDDTMMLSFLHDSQKPERTLKDLSLLHGISDYSGLAATGRKGNASGDDDPHLHYYNRLDAITTLKLYTSLEKLIVQRYGRSSSKLSDYSRKFRSDLLWLCFSMQQYGLRLDVKALSDMRDSINQALADIEKEMPDVTFHGPGSDNSSRAFIEDLLKTLGALDLPQVERTEKERKLSIGVNNINLIRTLLKNSDIKPLTPEDRARYTSRIELFDSWFKKRKLLTTYVKPLLEDRRKGITDLNTGECFPIWFPTPRPTDKDSLKIGGQRQGRLSCKHPAITTFPPEISSLTVSRYGDKGAVIDYDLSQIELRVAALLSGDQIMLDAYANGEDLHTITACAIDPSADPNDPAFNAKPSGLRQLGKTTNFLMIYRGSASALRQTAHENNNLDLSIDFCNHIISSFFARYSRLWEWQTELIRKVSKQGWMELPSGWSRNFGIGYSAVSSDINEICNFPVQCTAAQLLLSAQSAIDRELRRRRALSRIIFQVYDSIRFDIYLPEFDDIRPIIESSLAHPDYLTVLEYTYNRTLPLEFKMEQVGRVDKEPEKTHTGKEENS